MANFSSFNITALMLDDNETDIGCGYHHNITANSPLAVREYVHIVMYFVIFIIGTVGNTLVIATILRDSRMRTVTNLFLINLSICVPLRTVVNALLFLDLLFGIITIPLSLTGQIMKRYVLGAAMCKIHPYLQVASIAVNMFTLCSISIERFFAVCCPLTFRQWQTVSRSIYIRMTITIWVSAYTISIPVLFFNEQYKSATTVDGDVHYACCETFPSYDVEIAYYLTYFIVLFGLPGVFLPLIYLIITRTLFTGANRNTNANAIKEEVMLFGPKDSVNGISSRLSFKNFSRFRPGSFGRQSKRATSGECETDAVPITTLRKGILAAPTNNLPIDSSQADSLECQLQRTQNTQAERSLQAKKKVILMLLVVVLEFFICYAPLQLASIISVFDYQLFDEYHFRKAVPYLRLLMYFSTCCNPLIYFFLNSKFRTGMIEAVTCKNS